ncbi:MAG: polysaccharide deacetylase family protein [Caldilinea sp.]|jgi:peptidoglycan/xylan/chitin deacetylase (PgdA/CDA1 family)
MNVLLTVDLEQDCPPYLDTFRGMEQGVHELLTLLTDAAVPATFFATGVVARRYPHTLATLVAQGHELGGHGDTHRSFTRLAADQANAEIARSSESLRRLAPVTAFRAPYLQFPDAYLPLLEQHGYQIDASQARYKLRALRPPPPSRLQRLPASVPSSVLRLPDPLRRFWLNRLASPVVLFVHPWEFVDLRQEKLRLDCRFRTGSLALEDLQHVIEHFKAKDAQFITVSDACRHPA